MSGAPVSTTNTASSAPSQPLSELEILRQRVNYQLNGMRFQPVQQLPMNLFLMWMVGNDVSMFSIMFVGMAVVNPITNILNANKMFSQFEEEANKDAQIKSAVSTSKLIYIGCSLVAFLVALVKLTWMGLLPILAMDWMNTKAPTYKEHAIGVFV